MGNNCSVKTSFSFFISARTKLSNATSFAHLSLLQQKLRPNEHAPAGFLACLVLRYVSLAVYSSAPTRNLSKNGSKALIFHRGPRFEL